MKQSFSRATIAGSARKAVPDAQKMSTSDPNTKISISIYARRNPNPPVNLQASMEKMSAELPGKRKYLGPQEFDKLYGADPADLKKIETWAKTQKLEVVSEDVSQRRVKVQGTIGDISQALGVQLNEYDHPTLGEFRGRIGNISVPENLHGIIEGVFGLDTRPVGRPRFRRGNTSPMPLQLFTTQKVSRTAKSLSLPNNPWPGTFFPPQVAQLYNYPPGTDGKGQNIAVFAFNGPSASDLGGYELSALQAYFQKLGQSTPQIQDVVIQGMGNKPGPGTSEQDSSDEVMLDMCTVGSVVPGAKIFMYFTEFTSKGWVDAIHDAIAGENEISVISISYGNPEQDPNSAWTQMGVKLVNQAFDAAASLGITICCSSGDDGSSDEGSGPAEVDFPASSPNVLGVGGTKLVASAGANPVITSEVTWNEEMRGEGATGGGISVVFSKPSYQDTADVPVSVNPPHLVGRGVPDVSADADPETGLVIMKPDGKSMEPIGGTSASAPLWASLVIRLNEALQSKCGFLNELLYTKFSSGVLRDITQGNNGAYAAGPGWDACTGLGSPDGQKLLKALSGGPANAKSKAGAKVSKKTKTIAKSKAKKKKK